MNRPVLLFLLVLGSCAARDADVENWSIHDTIEWAKEQNLPDVSKVDAAPSAQQEKALTPHRLPPSRLPDPPALASARPWRAAAT
jgi:hypothetical protein